jgi:hypothetical protein
MDQSLDLVCSFDITPSDFFLWWYVKDDVHRTSVNVNENLLEEDICRCGERYANPYVGRTGPST